MSMTTENLWRDPEEGSLIPAPDHKSIIIPGKRGRILSLLYTAGGEGPKPTVLILHGFPGNEQNLDIAQALRRIGFSTMSFHYSGSWGSDGAYRFSHCLEDGETVLDYMISHAEELQIDPDRLFIFGHSLGGFAGANLLAKREEFRGGVLMAPADIHGTFRFASSMPDKIPMAMALLENSTKWLNDVTPRQLAEDVDALGDAVSFAALAEPLSRKDLLLITGEQDQTTPFALNQKPLLDRLEQLGRKNHTHLHLNTGHGFEDKRILVTERIADFLTSLC